MNRQPLVEHIPGLRRYARALTGDSWAADDLVQDTLERACSKWRLWAVGSDLRAWLFTVMHNLFVNQVRSASQQLQSRTLDIEEVAHELPDPDSDAAPAIDLQRCLMRLPAEQRAVLLLVTLEDMSYKDVARVTGVPMGTVMSRLSRGRTRLQELLDAPACPFEVRTVADTVLPLRRLK